MTQPKLDPEFSDRTDFTPDMRLNRARQMTAHVMHAIGKYITNEEDNFHARASRDLLDLFYDNGVDIITDQMRADAGLPLRGEKGWTNEELQIMEARRIEAMLKPASYLMPVYRTSLLDENGMVKR